MEPTPFNPKSLLNVKIAKGEKLIKTLEILYLKGMDKHTLVYFTDGICLETHHMLKWYEKKLLTPQYCRCHKSFIVNCFYIDCTCGNNSIMKKDNIRIPVSNKYRECYRDNLERYQERDGYKNV